MLLYLSLHAVLMTVFLWVFAWNYEIEPILNGAAKPNEEGLEALHNLI